MKRNALAVKLIVRGMEYAAYASNITEKKAASLLA
jgi:hypothetical protein